MTLQDIVNDFNDVAMYEILRESKKRYKIYDHQLEHYFIVSKVDWYGKIEEYLNNEILEDKFVMRDATYKDYIRLYTKLDILQTAIQEGATPHA